MARWLVQAFATWRLTSEYDVTPKPRAVLMRDGLRIQRPASIATNASKLERGLIYGVKSRARIVIGFVEREDLRGQIIGMLSVGRQSGNDIVPYR